MSQTYIPLDLRRLVRDRARQRCEYCLLPESAGFLPHEFDHIIAEKHGGPTDADNLALACVMCNKHKGSDVASVDPVSGLIVPLFNPRRDAWAEHFRFDGGRIVPLAATGRATERILRFNVTERVEERELLSERDALPSSS